MAQGQNKRAGHNPFQLSLCGMKVSQMVEVFRTAQVCVCVCVYVDKITRDLNYVVWF